MASLQGLLTMHRDHEPRNRSADLPVGAIGDCCVTAPSWSSALRLPECAEFVCRLGGEHRALSPVSMSNRMGESGGRVYQGGQ